MKSSEFDEAVENGKAQALTLERAKELKGKTILLASYHSQVLDKMIVGDIVSYWDYNKTQSLRVSMGYPSRTAYWDAEFTESAKRKFKDMLVLLDEKGGDNCIYCYTGEGNRFDEPTFTCLSDECVFFIECD